MGFVYKITNTVDGKVYVGKTVENIEHRWSNHCCTALVGNSPYHFHRAIRKYGPDAFVIDQVATTDDAIILAEAEKVVIEHFDLFKNGYNMTLGGEGRSGHVPSEEARRKQSKSMKGRVPWNKGKARSEETRRKISETLKINYLSEEYRIKAQLAQIDKHCGEKNPFFGKFHSQETKKKIGAANKGRVHSEETRRKIGVAARGNTYSKGRPAWNKGKTDIYSEETKAKMRIAALGRTRKGSTR